MIRSAAAALLSLLLSQTSTTQAPPSINDIVQAVSRNTREFQNGLPDILCKEKITSATYDSGKVHEQKVVEDILTYSRKEDAQRKILAIDGKPAKINAKMPDLPVNWNVSLGWILEGTFAPRVLQAHEYGLSPKPEENGRLVIQFATKKDQQEIKWPLDGKPLVARDSGTAWIDIASMQAVRIERNFFNLPPRHMRLKAMSDFKPVTIGDRQFWLPTNLRVETTERDPRKTNLFLAEYSDCKKFGADVTILPR